MASWSGMNGWRLSPTSEVPVVAYGASGTRPVVMTISEQMGWSSGVPQAAKAVAMGGWVWTMASYVGADAVDGEVHSDFAGDVAGAGDFVSVVIDDDHIRGPQH